MAEISFELDAKNIANVIGLLALMFLFFSSVWGITFASSPILGATAAAVMFVAFLVFVLKYGPRAFPYIFLLIIVASSLLINLNVTLNNPLIFGDEGYYAGYGELVAKNAELPRYIHVGSDAIKMVFQDAPLSFVFIGAFFSVGGEFLVKMMGPILAALCGTIVFLIGRRYSNIAGAGGALFLLAMPSFITYTILLYNHLLATFLLLASIMFLQKYFERGDERHLAVCGILGGLSLLTHQIMILFPAFLIVAFYLNNANAKRLLIPLSIFAIVFFSRYMLYNYAVTGYPGIPVLDNVFAKIGTPKGSVFNVKDIPTDASLPALGGIDNSGVNQNIFRMNFINYIEFAYSIRVFLVSLLGISYLYVSRGKWDKTILAWLVVIGGFTMYGGGFGSLTAESAGRAFLFIVPALAICAGVALSSIYNTVKTSSNSIGSRYRIFGYMMGGAGILIIAAFFVVTFLPNGQAYAKAASLAPIKQFSPGFFKACDWIRENTPEDSYIMTVWESRAFYACKRSVVWGELPDQNIILFSSDQRSVEHMKLHGIDYVFVQKFSISADRKGETFPQEFVNFLETKKEFFEKVYENEDELVYRVL